MTRAASRRHAESAVQSERALVRRRVRRAAAHGQGPGIIGNIRASHDDPASHAELREVLQAVTLLPEDQCEILMLAGPGGLTYREMAARFASADGKMTNSLGRVRASLAHSLALVKKPPGRKPQERTAAARRIGISDRRGCEPDRPA